MKNLVYTGGIFHDFATTASALAEVLADAGFETSVSCDLDDCARQLASGDIDLFTVCALRWRMLDGEKYGPYREDWALRTTPATRRLIEDYVTSGGGLLALHTAAICFDDWPEWSAMLGASWVWGQSWHPPLQAARVCLAKPEHPVLQGVRAFELVDEVYQALDLRGGIELLATAATGGDTQQHPVAWLNHYGKGRVFCNTLGHDDSSVRQPMHAELLRQGARWATH